MLFGWVVGLGVGMRAAGWAAVSSLILSSDAFVKSFLKEFGSFGDCCGHCGGCCGQLYLSLTSPPLCSSLDG